MQLALKNLLPENRAAWCLTDSCGHPSPPVIVQKLSKINQQFRYYKGLFSCKNGWICPHCAPTLARERAGLIELAIQKWRGERYGLNFNDPDYTSKKGKELRMALFTVPHNQNQELAPLIERIKNAFLIMKNSRGFKLLKKDAGIAGYISIIEVTYSKLNGWHPHYHVLFFLNKQVNDLFLKEKLFELWTDSLLNFDFKTPKIEGFGLQNADFASDYLSKHGRQPKSKWLASDELAKWHVKHGNESFTPFDLLEAHLLRMAVDKSLVDDSYIRQNAYKFFEEAGPLFIEFAAAFKGRHQCQWSRGLKELLTPSQKERAEAAIKGVSDEIEKNDSVQSFKQEEEVLYELSPWEWRQVNFLDARALFLNTFKEFKFYG